MTENPNGVDPESASPTEVAEGEYVDTPVQDDDAEAVADAPDAD